ncbi:MAG: hypothetical protein Q9228_007943, partial [Teloschistes exilis]
MEQHIVSTVPEISAALVIGAQRFQAALLIEPVENEKELSASERGAFTEKMWPVVEEANGDVPSHARIMKSHVLFTRQEKRMIRAGKGTVQRAGTLNAFADEIDALYRDAERLNAGAITASDDSVDETSASQSIEKIILSITSWPELQESQNVFTVGMDSLHAILVVRALRQNFGLPDIAPSTLYTNPSISSLAKAISVMQSQHRESRSSVQQVQLLKRNAILQEYRSQVDQIQPSSTAADATPPSVVVLTGSTGALGSFILDSLSKDPAVTQIYCLNRATESEKLQKERNKDR